MPAASTRSSWKGAISFGLVHIPVELRSATVETRPAFKWIDQSSNSAVGNKQVNKVTGQEVSAGNIVKGIEVEDGQFVTLSKEEIRAALPKTTQMIDIEAFVDIDSIPAVYFQKPYHVIPSGKGQKPYQLLKATLEKTGKVGLARVVISTKQHFAALMPMGDGMVLNLLRWAEEVRTMEGLPLPGDEVEVKPAELKMAEMLVNELARDWEPDLFHDEFKAQLAELIEEKTKAGNTIVLKSHEGEVATRSAEVLDLTEMLRRSLAKGAELNTARTPKMPDTRKSANDANVTPLRRAAASKQPAKAASTVKAQTRVRKG